MLQRVIWFQPVVIPSVAGLQFCFPSSRGKGVSYICCANRIGCPASFSGIYTILRESFMLRLICEHFKRSVKAINPGDTAYIKMKTLKATLSPLLPSAYCAAWNTGKINWFLSTVSKNSWQALYLQAKWRERAERGLIVWCFPLAIYSMLNISSPLGNVRVSYLLIKDWLRPYL